MELLEIRLNHLGTFLKANFLCGCTAILSNHVTYEDSSSRSICGNYRDILTTETLINSGILIEILINETKCIV